MKATRCLAASLAPFIFVVGASPAGVSFVPRSHNAPPRAHAQATQELAPRRQSEAANLSVSSPPISTAVSVVPYGGASPQTKEVMGALYFFAADIILRKAFKSIPFPHHLAGTCILFVVMVVAEYVRPGWGDAAFDLLNPGAGLLAKWLPVLFVPGLVMLPLAPSVGSMLEIFKVLSVVVVGFFFSLTTTTYTVLGIRNAQGMVPAEVDDSSKDEDETAPAPPPKPFSEETLAFLQKGFLLSAFLSVAASKSDIVYATPFRTIFMGFTTVMSYVWGARLPPAFTKIVHPLVTSTAITLMVTRLDAFATGSTFLDILRTYKSGSMAPLKTGAGDVLLFLLGPAVVSLAIAMYSRKQLMAENLLVVFTAMICSSVGGLFGTAGFVRMLNFADNTLRLSLLPRNVTTALAIAITNILGGDISLTAIAVVLTGILGATIGASVLTAMGIKDPISRGLGIGAAAQGLGVASFINEKDAFPFAAISMVLTAVCATVLVSIPFVKDAVVSVATGAAKEAAMGAGAGI